MNKIERWNKGLEFKGRLLQVVDMLPKDCSLCLSGGIDSSALLYAMLELKRPPVECISFQLMGYPTSDDVKTSKKICATFNIPFKVTLIPTDIKSIKDEVTDIIKVTGKTLKTHVHSCYPFRYIAEQASTKNLVFGTWSDSVLYAENRKLNVAKSKMTDDEFRKFFNQMRIDRWNSNKHSYYSMRKWIEHNGYNMLEPYHDKGLFDLALKLDWYEWHQNDNGTGVKQLMVMLFKDYFEKTQVNRRPKNMQSGTYIKEAHAKLLTDKSINYRNNKDLFAVYNNIREELRQNKLI